MQRLREGRKEGGKEGRRETVYGRSEFHSLGVRSLTSFNLSDLLGSLLAFLQCSSPALSSPLKFRGTEEPEGAVGADSGLSDQSEKILERRRVWAAAVGRGKVNPVGLGRGGLAPWSRQSK